MRRLKRCVPLHVLVLLGAAISGSAPAAQPDAEAIAAVNLVQNAGFEQVEAGKPTGWGLTGVTDLDNAQFMAGAMGLRVRHDQRTTSTAKQTVRCGEREYLAVVWVRTEGVEGAGARVRLLGPAGQRIADCGPVVGETAWHRIEVRFNPGNIGAVTVELSLADAAGSAWFDDVVIAEARKLTPLLEEAANSHTRENLALGKRYDLSPPPSYQYCTDPEDDRQLTDGAYTVGYFWTQKSTVGWYLYSPQVTVDLGRPEPIDGIMINCPGGGAAGVKFPNEITFLVSDDNEAFHEVARLTPRGLKQDGKNWYTHRFLADGLSTRGRYVMIRLDKAGSTVFADEIEIYRGDHDPAGVRFAGDPKSREAMAFAQYGITPDSYKRGHFPEWPHVKWATPLAGGPIKSILMAYSNDMREAVEIAQRCDLDYVPVQHFAYYRPTTLGDLMVEQIANALPQCQVMIVGGYRWEATPKHLLEKIKARVRQGMGLVCVSSIPAWLGPVRDVLDDGPVGDDQGILDLVPVASIPAYHKPGRSHLHLGTYGQGRVAWVNWGTFTRGGHSLIPSFRLEDIDDDASGPVEYAFAALCKVIQWAAGREVRRITGIDAAAGRVAVTLAPGEAEATLDVQVRDRYFDGGEPMTTKVSKAGGPSGFSHDIHLVGPNFADVWVRDATGAVLDFGSVAFVTEREARIESVDVAKPLFAPGEPIRATVRVTGETGGLRLLAVLEDTYGRQLAPRLDVPVGADGAVALTFENEHALALCAVLSLELRKSLEGKNPPGRERLDRHMVRVWSAVPERDDYTFCAWYAWDFQPSAFHGLRMLRDLGVDTYVSLPGTWRAENAAFVNMRHGPENVERVYPRNKDDSLVRVPCLSDPAYRAGVGERIEKMAQDVRRLGVLAWSLGDESTLGRRDYCRSPTCLAGFREYVRGAHGSLEALNRSWDTGFASWEDVVPATKQDVEGRTHLGQWLEHRRYMEKLFADYHTWCAELIVKHIPHAKVGISGTPRVNAYSGHDWWQLMQRALTHLSGYGGVQRALQRSFLRPGTFYSTFLGYDYKDTNEQGARYSAWDLLFHGANGINYYTLVSNTLNCPMVRPDGSFTNKAPWFFEEVKELKAGLGKLFMSAAYESDGIAVHYSPPSVHAAHAVGLFDHRDALRNYNINLTNVCNILRQCQLQFDFVHADQMADGQLSPYRLLVLPWSSCIGETEAEAIATFVREGGTVLADSFCGVRDDHGAPRPILDGLFGVEQPLAVPDLQHGTLRLDLGDDRGTREIPVASGTAELHLAGGTSAGKVNGAPACIVNKVGRGRAILLNCSFSNYGQVWDGGAAGEVLEETASPEAVTRPIRRFVATLVRQADVRPAVVDGAGAGASPELELSRFVLGDARLLGVVGSAQAGPVDEGDITGFDLTLAQPTHVYESRGGAYLGRTKLIEHRAPRGIARVYAVLPYAVRDVLVEGSDEARPGDAVRVGVRVQTDGGRPGVHVVHLSVGGPDGNGGRAARAHYAQNVVANEGRATVEIPFAYNDPPGSWTIEARDVATGVTGRLSLRLVTP